MTFIPVGATSRSLNIQIVDDEGLPVTGLVAATFPSIAYIKAGSASSTGFSIVDLVGINPVWASGGIREIQDGFYRLDIPNGSIDTLGIITFFGEATGKRMIPHHINCGLDLTGTTVGLTTAAMDALLDLANGVETGVTPRQAMRAAAAILAGIISGAGTGTEVFKGIGQAAGGTTRATVTVDANGNRSAVSLP